MLTLPLRWRRAGARRARPLLLQRSPAEKAAGRGRKEPFPESAVGHADRRGRGPPTWKLERGVTAMDENTFQQKLAELVQEIGALPKNERAKLEALAEQTKERHRQLKQTVAGLQDSIDYLRLSIKYLLFDLEATRRENNYLRKMIEEEPGTQPPGPEA